MTGPVLLAIRPEQVQVRPVAGVDGRPGGAGGAVTGEIAEVSFFGHDATVRTRMDDGAIVTARVPADVVPPVGDRVCLTVLGSVVAFAAGAAS